MFVFSIKEDQYLSTNDFLDAVREEFDRNWSKWWSTNQLTVRRASV